MGTRMLMSLCDYTTCLVSNEAGVQWADNYQVSCRQRPLEVGVRVRGI